MGRKYISLLEENENFLKFIPVIKLVIEQNISAEVIFSLKYYVTVLYQNFKNRNIKICYIHANKTPYIVNFHQKIQGDTITYPNIFYNEALYQGYSDHFNG